MQIHIDFARLHTPPEHGDVLIEPGCIALPHLVEHNRTLIDAYDFTVGGLSIRDARELLRRAATEPMDIPLIVTGHQPDFIHAGVWAKHVVAQRLARAVGGKALNLIVDHDAPKQTALPAPEVRGDRVQMRRLCYADWTPGAAFEFMPAADVASSRRLAEETRTALGERFARSMLPRFFDSYVDRAGRGEWVNQAVHARRSVEHSLGGEVDDRLVSRLWCGPLMTEMLAEPERFAAAYNAALASYRRTNRVRSADRPVPDLHCNDQGCELAVWAYRPGEPRRRVFVRHRGAALELLAAKEVIGTFDAERVGHWDCFRERLCSLAPWVLRPRALTLTLWARLLLADVFVHGIGGARYDRVTDDLIRNYFRVEPPGMACASATLRLALPQHRVAAGARGRARHRLRDLRHNPERYIDGTDVDEHTAAKDAAIRESIRLRAEDPRNRAARRRAFDAIRDCNARINALRPGLDADFASRLRTLERRAAENRAARRRDYFFAMHPRCELEMLLEKLPSVQDLSRSAIV